MSYFATKKGKFLLDFLRYGFFMLLMYLFSVGGIRNQIFPFAFRSKNVQDATHNHDA